MSNFICSECGMTNIDCGYAGYKTPKEIELLKKVEQLERRLKDAEEALKDFCEDCTLSKCGGCDEDCAGWKAKEYLERYGVK